MSNKKGKRYNAIKSKIVANKFYSLEESLALLKDGPLTKFDQNIDLCLTLNIDAKNSEQLIRGVAKLRNGLGKKVNIMAFVKDNEIQDCLDAGATYAGNDDLVEKIQSSRINVDWCVAKPDLMPVVGKVAKILGPQGLMPNPKMGTVTTNIVSVIKDLPNSIGFRSDKGGNLHANIGKISFDVLLLKENISDFINSLVQHKSSSNKGSLIKEAYISATMSPSIKIDTSELNKNV